MVIVGTPDISGVVMVVGFPGDALIAWVLPRGAMVEEMASGWRQAATMRLLPHGAIVWERFMPVAVLVVLAITAVF